MSTLFKDVLLNSYFPGPGASPDVSFANRLAVLILQAPDPLNFDMVYYPLSVIAG